MRLGHLRGLAGGASAGRWYYGPTLPTVDVAASIEAPAPGEARHRTRPEAVHIEAAVTAEEPDLSPEPALAQPRVHRSIPHEKAEPEDLLQRANRLRAEGRFESAAETYALVYERYPRSLSAYAARSRRARSSRHLGKPNQRAAVRECLRATRPARSSRGARASPAMRNGARQGETQALRARLEVHAESPAARRAEARLKELLKAGAGSLARPCRCCCA